MNKADNKMDMYQLRWHTIIHKYNIQYSYLTSERNRMDDQPDMIIQTCIYQVRPK